MSARVSLVRRMLRHQPLRTGAAVLAVAASAFLLFFLDGLRQGVLDAAASYAGQPGVDVWLARRGTENLVRSSSVLPLALAGRVGADPRVARAAPLLRAFVRVEGPGGRATLLGLGYHPALELGAPPRVVAGGGALGRRDVLLDRGAAHRLGAHVGDTLRVNGEPAVVRGLSDGTNLLGTQMIFGRLDRLVGLSGAVSHVSFVLVRLRDPADTSAFIASWTARDSTLAGFTRGTFARNNVAEIDAGFAPIFGSLGVQAGLVAAAVIALLLYGRVIERRADYAVILALGGAPRDLARIVVTHALVLGGLGAALALLGMPLVAAGVARRLPELAFALAPAAMARSAAIVLAAAVLGALLPIARLRSIEPAEVFRA